MYHVIKKAESYVIRDIWYEYCQVYAAILEWIPSFQIPKTDMWHLILSNTKKKCLGGQRVWDHCSKTSQSYARERLHPQHCHEAQRNGYMVGTVSNYLWCDVLWYYFCGRIRTYSKSRFRIASLRYGNSVLPSPIATLDDRNSANSCMQKPGRS